MKLSYVEANCYKYTFDAYPVKQYVEKVLYGDVVNLFAGKNLLVGEFIEYRVDSSNEFKPAYHMKAQQFIELKLAEKHYFDCVVWDPPWNPRKSKEYYNGHYIGKFQRIKPEVVKLVKLGGLIISIGYEITYFGRNRGFELIELLIVNPKGEIRPYFVSVEQKTLESVEMVDWL